MRPATSSTNVNHTTRSFVFRGHEVRNSLPPALSVTESFQTEIDNEEHHPVPLGRLRDFNAIIQVSRLYVAI